jgi:hypothetical protein
VLSTSPINVESLIVPEQATTKQDLDHGYGSLDTYIAAVRTLLAVRAKTKCANRVELLPLAPMVPLKVVVASH